jgi:hypothetical protein
MTRVTLRQVIHPISLLYLSSPGGLTKCARCCNLCALLCRCLILSSKGVSDSTQAGITQVRLLQWLQWQWQQ